VLAAPPAPSASRPPSPPATTDRATAYAHAVVAGKVVAGKWVRLACERHLRDLTDARARGFWWDAEAVGDIELFFSALRHTKGQWAGEPILLEDHQCFIYGCVLGWKRVNGLRRFETAYVEVARKNGKSTGAAGLGLELAFEDGEPGADVYSAATKRDQAKVVWGEARKMVLRSPSMRRRVRVLVGNLSDEESGSKFEPLGADADSLDGLNVHGAIVDELHAHKTRAMWDVLETATGSRRQPLIFAITTAGSNRGGVCYEQHLYAKKVLEGTVEDDTYFAAIYAIDDEDEWTDEACWPKANPNLGVSVRLDDLRKLARRAKEMPSAQTAFLTKRLNRWVNADQQWMDMRDWLACGAELRLEDFRQDEALVGVDLASKDDIAATVYLFRRLLTRELSPADQVAWVEREQTRLVAEADQRGDEVDEATLAALVAPTMLTEPHVYLIPRFYLPEWSVRAPGRADTANYPGWAAGGHVRTTPGNMIDQATIEEDLRTAAQQLGNLRAIGFDPYQAWSMVTNLRAANLPVEEFGATVKNFSDPMKEFAALTRAHRLHHDGNPVMTWMVSNVVCHTDAKDNIYPRKPSPALKIDGAVAALIALGLALQSPGKTVSVYEARGLITL